MKNIIFGVAVCLVFSFCAPCSATLLFKMTCADTSLTIGEETTITLWAKADDPGAVGMNGVDLWALSMIVSGDDALQVKSNAITFLAPSPFSVSDSKYDSINAPKSGNVTYLRSQADNPNHQNSTTGVGVYSPIAEIVVKGIAKGVATYSIGGSNFFGVLKDDTWLEGTFDSANSDKVFTVAPEPCSLAMLAAMAAIGLRRRK